MILRINIVSTVISVLVFAVFLECSGSVFTRNYYGLREAFEDDIPQGASTLAFVFDITGSMYDDLVQVIAGAARILSTILARREKAIYNYVLVPFHDPDIGPVTVTTDPDLFQRQLKELYVQGGGDCPEMSIGAIKLALEVCLPNSHIYVFTDARAKDYYLLDDVLKLIQRKQSQVVFVMTGDCGNHSHPGYQAYERIASTSSGQVFHLMKSDVDEVLNFVRVSLQARKVNLFAVDRHAGDLREFEFDVDGNLREFTISVSGESPVITVINSRGEVVDQRKGLLELLNHKNISIVNIKDPPPGRWKLRVNSGGAHTIRATGLSKIDFVHGFSRQPTANLKETYHRPLKGAPTYLLVNATDLPEPATFQNVKIVDLEGNNLQNIPLHRFPGTNLFNASTFYPPNKYFYLKVAGADEYGFPMERMTSTAISAQLPDIPEVSTRSRMIGYYDEDTDLRCYIQSLVPFSAIWYKDGVPVSQEQQFPQTTEIILTVPEVTMLSEGYYSCNATNIAGRGSSVIFLDVKEPPPAITKSGNVSGIVGSVAVLPCEVESVVDYNVTWTRIVPDENNIGYIKAAPLPDIARIIVHRNDSLVIHKVSAADEGWYRCTAANDGGIAQEHLFLHTYSMPVVQVIPNTHNFASGDFINLTCIAVGHPEPHIRWIWSPVHNTRFLSGKSQVVDKNMLIHSAEPEDEGRYDCVGTSAAGTHSASAFLNYIEAPHISLPDQELVVKNGEQAVLRCIGEGIPDPQIKWFKGLVEVQPLSYIQISSDGSLLIYDVQETDAGNYTCVAENEAGSTRETMFLNVGSKPSLIKFPGTSSVNVLQNITIPCIASGTPAPVINWLFENGSAIHSDSKLSVTHEGHLFVQEADPSVAGKYVCQAQNKFGTMEQTVELSVTGIKKPILSPLPSLHEIPKGGKLSIPCLVLDGNPKPSVSWLMNGNPIRPGQGVLVTDGRLEIDRVDAAHEANYTCFASNMGGYTSEDTQVNVLYEPVISSTEQQFSATEGSPVNLPCSVTGDPKPEILWLKDGVELISKDAFKVERDGSLSIKAVREEDEGEYVCSATNIIGTSDQVFKLLIKVPPRIEQPETSYNATEGGMVTLPCTTYAKPPASIRWSRGNDKDYSSDLSKFVIFDGSLQLKTKFSDSGTYICVAENEVGVAHSVMQLNVHVPPSVFISNPEKVFAKVGETVSLICEASGHPPPSISWEKDGIEVHPSSSVTLDASRLILHKVRVSDEGQYFCVAQNLAGTAKEKRNIYIHEKPVISPLHSSAEHISATIGDKIDIFCNVSGYPPPEVIWNKSKNDIVHTIQNGRRHIPYVQESDAGIYTCIAQNSAGFDSRTFNLSVFAPPVLNASPQRNIHANLGNNILLDCSTVAFPPPTVIWAKDNDVISFENKPYLVLRENGQVLEIQEVGISDSGQYKCVVKNPAGEISNEFELEVSVPPSFITPYEPKWHILKNDSLTLDCSADGMPTPLYVWRKNGQLITSSLNPTSEFKNSRSILLLNDVRESDAGMYSCVVMNKVGSSSRDFEVSVLVPAAIQGDSREEQEAMLHQMTEMNCAVSGNPVPTVLWYKDGIQLFPDGRKIFLENDNEKLILLKPERDDSGLYSCSVSNSVGQARKDVKLSVLSPPSIGNQTITESYRIKEGENLLLRCEAFGNPSPKIMWMKNNQPLESSNSSDFMLFNVSRRDAGRYVCIASNKAGSTDKDFNVVILSPPKMDSPSRSKYSPKKDKREVIENSPVVITCPFSSYPVPQYTWTHNGQILSAKRDPFIALTDNGKVLNIKYAKLHHSGNYTCIARNEAGESSEVFMVDVMVAPSSHSDPISSVEVKEHEPLILKCETSGNPVPSILWMKDGTELVPDLEVQFSSDHVNLEILDAMDHHSGVYVCIASNIVGSIEKEFNVNVLTSPHLNGEVKEFRSRPTAYVNKPVTLKCPLSGNPAPHIRWFRNGTNAELNEDLNIFIYEDGQKLSMLRPKETDSDVYICVADNGVGTSSYEFALDILVPPTINKNGMQKVYYVKEGDSVNMKCPVSGYPVPVITWLKDSDVIPLHSSPHIHFSERFQSLHLPQTSLRDAGTYTCIAGNEIGTDEVDFKLDVQVPPKLQNSEERPENQTAVLNKPVSMSCPVSGIPPPQVKWFKDSQPLASPNIMLSADSRHLKIFRAQSSDAGTYVCRASNDVGKVEKEFNLLVYVPPKIIEPNSVLDYYSEDEDEMQNELKAIENETTELECYVEGNPKPLVLWIKDGYLLNPDSEKHYKLFHNGQLLQIREIKPSDAGLYTCVASNLAGTKEKNFLLDIYVPPKIKGLTYEVHDIMPNRPAELECFFESNPASFVSWYKDGKRIEFTEHDLIQTFENGKVLQLLKANSKDRGHYTCIVENNIGKTEKNFKVDVFAPPVILGSDVSKEVLENEKVLMECSTQGNPRPSIVWLKEGHILSDEQLKNLSLTKVNEGSILKVAEALKFHSGKYKCIASNVAGSTEKTFEIYVKVPPRIMNTSEPNMTVLINQPVTMLCSAEAEPPPVIVWTKDGHIINDVTNPFFTLFDDGQRLQLLRARESDEGQYSCRVSNVVGNDTRLFVLNVLVPPRVKDILNDEKVVNVVEGNSSEIQCYVHGNPHPTVTWLKNGKPLFPGKNKNILFLDRNQILHFKNVSAVDGGPYSCIASSPLGTLKRNFEHNVQVPPKIHDDITHDYIAYLNKPLMIHCEVDGIPKPSITWMKNGIFIEPFLDPNIQFLKDDSALLLKWARIEDSGKYTCTATNSAGQDEKNFNIHVYIPAYIENIGLGDKVLGIVNQTITLQCPAHGIPAPSISWLKDEKLIAHSSTNSKYQIFEGGKTLQIHSAEENDSGKYKCFATNDAGTDSLQLTVDVMVPPQLVTRSKRNQMKSAEGESVLLSCPIKDSSYFMTVTWKKNGKLLNAASAPPHFDFSADNKNIRIRKSQAPDTGVYSCTASNSAGQTEYESSLLVLVSPQIVYPSENITSIFVKEHHSITFECVSSGHPVPVINWLKNGFILSENHNFNFPTAGKLKVLDASANDSGVYSCIAENEDGFDLRHYNLTVYVPPTINVSSHGLHKVILQSGEVLLDCPATGVPQPRLIWYKGSQMLTPGPRVTFLKDGEQLKISHAIAADAGKYTCLAVNEAGDTEAEHLVKILVPPLIDQVSIQGALEPVVNQSLRIQCDAQGLPFPNILWFKNKVLIHSNDSRMSYSGGGRYLDIREVLVSDSGWYECYAENSAGYAKKGVKLFVAVPPQINESSKTKMYAAVLGKPLRMECDATGTPLPAITWLKNGLPLEDKENVHLTNDGFTLMLTYALEEDSADYTCIASNNAGLVEQKFNLTVLVPPSLEDSPKVEEVVAVLGSSSFFECPALGHPPPDVVWLKDNAVLSHDIDVSAHGSTLELFNIHVSHNGSYTCEISNVAGKVSKTFHLNVSVPPTIEGSDETTFISTSVKSPIILECSASGTPIPALTWFRNGIPLIPGYFQNFHFNKNSSKLTLPSSVLKDSGLYMCLATNSAGNDSRNFVVNVLEPPTIENGASTVKAQQDKEVILDCNAKGIPKPEITWLKDGSLIPHLSSKLVEKSSLYLDNLKLENSGIYTCIASNEVGIDTKDFTLQVGAPPVFSNPNVHHKVLSGDSVSLSCDASGFPAPHKMWLKNSVLMLNSSDHMIDEDGTLHLTNVSTEDIGLYVCLVENDVGSQEAIRRLDVLIPPTIESASMKYETVQAQPVVLPCSAEGTPQPTIHWEHNDVPVDLYNPRFKVFPSGDLHIALSQSSDMGTYTCIAKNEAGSAIKSVDLIVFVPPVAKINGPNIVVVTKGRPLVVSCSSSGFPVPKVVWQRNGNPVSSTNTDSSGQLVFESVQPEDRGNYVCVASNSAGRDQQSITLEVHVPPSFSALPRSQDILIGDSFTLLCEAYGNPIPSISWLFNNNPILGASHSVLGRSKLTINSVGKDDQGTYICLAQNAAGERKAAAAVRVRAPPVILQSSDVESVHLKETVILNCLVRGDPLPNIIWIKNGQQVEMNHRIQLAQNGSLFIYNSSDYDSGEYKCVASNDFGFSEHVAELIVQSQPQFVIEPHNMKVEAGTDVHLHCKAKGEPKPDVYWTKDSDILVNGDRIIILPNATLKIVSVQPADESIFGCYANNSLGEVLAEAQLIVQVNGKWSQWEEWGHCSTSCGDGIQVRKRLCNDPVPRNGGKTCIGVSSEAKYCSVTPCPVHGEWGNWMEWGACSQSCGVGERMRHRKCDNPHPEFNGDDCVGSNVETISCMHSKCSVDGQWSLWSEWQPCSVTCGKGIQYRTRECNDPEPLHGGLPCFGDSQELDECDIGDCPVHGEWGEWSEWSLCSSSCGGGTRERSRECDSPAPAFEGHYCSGSHIQLDYCNNAQCPVNGNWGEWSSWGECSASCNKGQKKRFRACDNPAPAGGGRDCSGPAQQTDLCSTHLCPINGKWSEWTPWSACSVTCGIGFRSRIRACDSPEAVHGGKDCLGDGEETEECGDEACDAIPEQAVGHVMGVINGVEFGLSRLTANMSQRGMSQMVSANLENVTEDIAGWLKLLVPLLNSIYWTTAYELGAAANGYTTTKGFFRRETQVNFATGQILHMTHVARGLDKRGVLLVDIVISGEVPDVPSGLKIIIHPYIEEYVQMGPGLIYAFSTRTYEMESHIIPYSWNHSIFYDETLDGMPFPTQQLYASDISSCYEEDTDEMKYNISAAIRKGFSHDDCAVGFFLSPEGLYCLDIDECEDESICSHICNNFPGGYSCQCFKGFSLDLDGKSCHDIDECKLNLAKCSPSHECINEVGSYKCLIVCRHGYKRSEDDLYCNDVNECEESHNCSHICINNIGSYSCSCHVGYRLLEPYECLDIDECQESSCTHFCTNIPGSYRCSCPQGFELHQGSTCQDIDECVEEKYSCLPSELCKNTIGAFECHTRCNTGLISAANGSCIDIDECEVSSSVCHHSQVCINVYGSYHCSCFQGYYSEGPGKPCRDINECLQRPVLCSYQCHNLPGDYECECAPGLKRLPDRKTCAGIEYLDEPQHEYLSFRERPVSTQTAPNILTQPPKNPFSCLPGFHFKHEECIDINECEDEGRCQHLCENTQGSYRCICPEGYQLESSGKKCQDINECLEFKIECGPDQMCFNTRGSYECIETPCPPKYDRDPLTGYCILECAKSSSNCPSNIKYSEILAFKMVALPSGIQAYQDLIRLVAYDQDGIQLPNTVFSIIENDTGIPFRIRLENGKGILYTQKSMESNREYKIKVQAISYDADLHTVQYTTKFLVFVSVSQYPY